MGPRVAATTLPDRPLDLQEAIRLALANNPGVAAGGWDVEAAAAQKAAAVGELFPSLHGVGAYSHSLDQQRLIAARGPEDPGVFSRNLFSTDLVVTMPLFTGGRIISQIRGADLLRQASEQRLARTREELVFNVSSVYYGMLAQRHVIESLVFSQQALREHLRRVEDLIAAQKAARVDLLRTEVRLADLQQQLVRERNVLAVLQRVLGNLLGLEDAAQVPDVAGELVLEAEAAVPPQAEALALANLNRGDFLAARAALEAQATAVDAARAGRWPTVSLQGAYGGRWAIAQAGSPADASTAEDAGRIGLVADIPIFEGGRIVSRIREQRARLAAAQERYRQLELQVRLDVETALLNVVSSLERVQATQKAIEQAKESLRIERQRYDLGRGSITDVLDSQAALLDAQTTYYRALAEHNTSLAQLRLAMGEDQ
jgi:outer membrane protein TolC